VPPLGDLVHVRIQGTIIYRRLKLKRDELVSGCAFKSSRHYVKNFPDTSAENKEEYRKREVKRAKRDLEQVLNLKPLILNPKP